MKGNYFAEVKMEPRDIYEPLLWGVGGKVRERSSEVLPADAELEAFRAGTLTAQRVAQLEAVLASSPAARRRLAELAGVASVQPPADLRRRVLEGFEAEFEPATSRVPGVRRLAKGAELRRWLPLAAVAMVCLGTLFLMRTTTPPPLPEGLTYEVAAEGLAAVRGVPQVGERVSAYPDTLVRITATPRISVEDVDFALYRQQGDSLEKVPFGPDVRLETRRGAAVVTAKASAVTIAGEPSTKIFLVMARPGDLPARIDLRSFDSLPQEALQAAGRRRAHALEIDVLTQQRLE